MLMAVLDPSESERRKSCIKVSRNMDQVSQSIFVCTQCVASFSSVWLLNFYLALFCVRTVFWCVLRGQVAIRALRDMVLKLPMVRFHQSSQKLAIGASTGVLVIYDIKVSPCAKRVLVLISFAID